MFDPLQFLGGLGGAISASALGVFDSRRVQDDLGLLSQRQRDQQEEQEQRKRENRPRNALVLELENMRLRMDLAAARSEIERLRSKVFGMRKREVERERSTEILDWPEE